MSNFGGAFGVFVIIVVTLAQLLGNGKRNKNKNAKGGANKNQNQGLTWSKKQNKKKELAAKSEGKIFAEEATTSFEVDGGNHSDVQGFDVK